jgi:hypothetical protein
MRSAAGARALGSHPERRGKPRRAPCWRPTSWLVARPVTQGPRQRATGPVIGCEAKNVTHAGAGALERFSIAELTLAEIQIQLGAVRTWTLAANQPPHRKADLDQAARNGGADESACSGHENLVFVARAVAREGISRSPEDTRTSLPQEALSSILQPLDQAVGAARGDDRRKFVAARRQITDGPVEIDVDHPSAADQIVYVHDPAARLH